MSDDKSIDRERLKKMRRFVRDFKIDYSGINEPHPELRKMRRVISGLKDLLDEVERLRNGILGIAMDAKHMEPEDIESDLRDLLDGSNDE